MIKVNPNVKKINSISFVLALDFSPYELLSSKQISEAEIFRKDENWFNKALELANYKDVPTDQLPNFYVNIENVSEQNLLLFLAKHLEDEQQNEMDEMIRLRGGTIVLNSKEIIFSPTCCTDITDYDNWSNLERTEEFKSIWIGHPWVLYKTDANSIYLTDYIEANGDEIDDSKIKYEVALEYFSNQAIKLKSQMDTFESRVNQCLQKLGVKNPEKISNCIVRGNCEPKF